MRMKELDIERKNKKQREKDKLIEDEKKKLLM